jgi:uncharacterized OB-fold protein
VKRQLAHNEVTAITKWRGEIPIRSFYTPGLGGQIFFEALKNKGQLVGTRCDTCTQVYLPARRFCERCFAELTEQIQIKPEGVVKSFTFCNVDHDGKHLQPALALALAQLEGATTLLLHRLLDVTDPSHVSIGSRVRVVIKPKAQRTGSILDIEGFRLLD